MVIVFIGLFALAGLGGCPSFNLPAGLGDANSPGGGTPTDPAAAGSNGSDPNNTQTGNGTGSGGDVTTFTLTLATDGEGTVDPVGGKYEKGERVELHATPGTGWRFDHWEGGIGGLQNPLMIVMDADYTVTAVFTAVIVFPIRQFYAIYDPIVDSATLGDSVGRSGDYCSSICAISSNGQRVAFGNTFGGSDRKLYMVNSNGTSPTAYDLPGTEGTTKSVAIDSDGSRVFVSDPYATAQAIYKLEGGAITTIALNTGPGSPGAANAIYTTADGMWVYFVGSGDIWRVRHDGGARERIVDHAAVPCTDAGYGGAIGGLAVSADGGVLAFTMLVNRDYPRLHDHARRGVHVGLWRPAATDRRSAGRGEQGRPVDQRQWRDHRLHRRFRSSAHHDPAERLRSPRVGGRRHLLSWRAEPRRQQVPGFLAAGHREYQRFRAAAGAAAQLARGQRQLVDQL
jgi:hypothetical protein